MPRVISPSPSVNVESGIASPPHGDPLAAHVVAEDPEAADLRRQQEARTNGGHHIAWQRSRRYLTRISIRQCQDNRLGRSGRGGHVDQEWRWRMDAAAAIGAYGPAGAADYLMVSMSGVTREPYRKASTTPSMTASASTTHGRSRATGISPGAGGPDREFTGRKLSYGSKLTLRGPVFAPFLPAL